MPYGTLTYVPRTVVFVEIVVSRCHLNTANYTVTVFVKIMVLPNTTIHADAR